MAKSTDINPVPLNLRDGQRIIGKVEKKDTASLVIVQKSGQAYELAMGEALSKALADTKAGESVTLKREGAGFKVSAPAIKL